MRRSEILQELSFGSDQSERVADRPCCFLCNEFRSPFVEHPGFWVCGFLHCKSDTARNRRRLRELDGSFLRNSFFQNRRMFQRLLSFRRFTPLFKFFLGGPSGSRDDSFIPTRCFCAPECDEILTHDLPSYCLGTTPNDSVTKLLLKV